MWVNKVFGAMVGLAVLGSASLGRAAETGFEVGARLGYGIPMGKLADSDQADLSDAISGMVPLQLDLGYRATPNLMVGGYIQYGFGFAGDGWDSAHDIRAGAQLQYHISPREKIDPWLGAGIGYE